uniref:THAP domain-containing protein 1 n=1 Tax=Xiphophorus couchianus TaxID=32473 RepID=A0A3B5M1Y4_9TELE
LPPNTCCVPQCTASSKYNGLLSFHGFPSDPDLRRQWLANIRRDKLKLTQHTKVCSLHFTPDQLLQPKAAGGRRVVSRGAVPVLFSWSHRSVQPPRAGLRRPDKPANLDGAENENQKLKEDMNALKEQAGELEIPPSFGLQRFYTHTVHTPQDDRNVLPQIRQEHVFSRCCLYFILSFIFLITE